MIHQRRPDNRIPAPLVEALTPREKQVLALLAQGLSNKQIANILCVNWRTVQYHLANIYLKLGANNRTHAALLAITHEIVSKN